MSALVHRCIGGCNAVGRKPLASHLLNAHEASEVAIRPATARRTRFACEVAMRIKLRLN